MKNYSYYILCLLILLFFVTISYSDNIEFFTELVKRDQ